MLNAYRERIKNPLPKPIPLHEGPCAIPEKGSEIYEDSKYRKYDPYGGGIEKKKYKERDAMDFVVMEIK